MAASDCQWQNGALHGVAPTLPRSRQRTENPPYARSGRHRSRRSAQPHTRRVGRREDHADVRPMGILRGRAPLRVLSARAQGARSMDSSRSRRPAPGAARARRAAAPAFRAPRLGRARSRRRRRRAARAPLAAPRARGRSARRGAGLSVGAVLALAERFWRGEVRGPDLVRATGAVEEIAPGVLFVHAFANVTALRTDAGLVLVDTGNYRARDKTFAAVRGWDARALVAGVYTHGHVDHACGLPPFLEEARTRGICPPRSRTERGCRARARRALLAWRGARS
ncbi:MAG: hypothetical protein DMD85_17920 [Candidatus Rokuibacteriota bacterium]|nr:MAG: hypothetical protein DMD85_17920 [Candidatus Rokubacteria bacterium]